MARASLLAMASSLAAVAAAPLGWLGITYSASTNTVVLNNLNTDGSIAGAVGSFALQAGEAPQVDAFRCQPDGTSCSFLADTGSGAALYNVSVAGKLLGRTPIPGVAAHNLHIDMFTGMAITVALPLNSGAGGGRVVGIVGNKALTVMDISAYIPAGSTVLPGGTTHCSDNGSMWVTVSAPGGGNALMLRLALRNATVVATQQLTFPGFSALWAHCDDSTSSNTLGGVYVPTPGVLAYGEVDATGAFVASASGPMPPGVAPSGLLSQPDGADWLAALYAPGARTGYFAFGNFDGGANSLQLVPQSYFLWGAARFQ